MKRALLILLMTLLPLQMSWASMAGIRDLTETNLGPSGVEKVSQRAAESLVSTKFADKVDRGCCPGCHAFCSLAAATPAYRFNAWIPLDHSFLTMLSDATAYQSHIPDEPIRPKWTAAS